MEHIGIDVHQKQSSICIIGETGTYVERTIHTKRERFAAVLGERPPARIIVEAATESEWVARCLEGLGHEVIVADPNFTPMYGRRSRRVKTDRRDARVLAEACRSGVYRKAHRASDSSRMLRRQLAVRDVLVHTRVRTINVMRTVVRQEGLRVRSGSTITFRQRLAELKLSSEVSAVIRPLEILLGRVEQQLLKVNAQLAKRAERDEVSRRLCSVTGIGPVTVAAYIAAIDDPDRFGDARHVASYLGLVPSERSSGERQRRGRITKVGNSRARRLLVEVGWSVLRGTAPQMTELREWGRALARRRGRQVAVVAIARRLARILYALWRDGTEFEPAEAATMAA